MWRWSVLPAVLAMALPADEPAWQPPLGGHLQVVRRFDPPAGPYAAGHRGVDLAAEPGSAVLAAAAGVVDFAGPVGGRSVVVLRHGTTTSTEYEPLIPVVVRGDQVAGGAVIGVLAPSAGHCGRTSCLHWGLRRAGRYEDPMTLLQPTGPVLLPFLSTPAGDLDPSSSPQPGAVGPASKERRTDTARLTTAGGAAATGALVAAIVPAIGRRFRRGRPEAR